ncbi:MAG: FHA domain-containing protein [Pseudonocardiaceae bacterium]|nr:FHA domain-containing protein [Pseudonocardiaceae bacterium]
MEFETPLSGSADEPEATRRMTPGDLPAGRPSGQPAQEGAGTAATGSALLEIARGPGGVRWFTLDAGTTTAGRGRDCGIVLDDPTVSRRHAEFRHSGAGVIVADVGSLNGTYVNNTPVDQAPLTDGDQVWIGKFRLVFHAGTGA